MRISGRAGWPDGNNELYAVLNLKFFPPTGGRAGFSWYRVVSTGAWRLNARGKLATDSYHFGLVDEVDDSIAQEYSQ